MRFDSNSGIIAALILTGLVLAGCAGNTVEPESTTSTPVVMAIEKDGVILATDRSSGMLYALRLEV